jgi:hypothetical protein
MRGGWGASGGNSRENTKDFILKSAFNGVISDGAESVNLNVIGDSTGNDSNEWVRLLATKLSQNTEGYNIKHHAYDTVNGRYLPPTKIKNIGEDRHILGGSGVKRSLLDSMIKVPADNYDVDVAIKVQWANWNNTTTRALVSKDTASDGNRCWKVILNSINACIFSYTTDGNASTNVNIGYISGLATMPTDEPVFLRFTFKADNGAGGKTFAVFRSLDEGVTWTQIGATNTSAGVTQYFKNPSVPYQVMQGASDAFPAKIYNFKYYDTDGIDIAPRSIEAFQSPATDGAKQTIQGMPDINIWNGSIPGAGLTNFNTGDTTKRLIVNNIKPIVVVNTSHNEAFVVGKNYDDLLDTFTAKIKEFAYKPLITFTTQNPQGSNYPRKDQHAQRRIELIKYAFENRYITIDAYQAFLDAVSNGVDFSTLVDADGVHPLTAGSTIWADKVFKSIMY